MASSDLWSYTAHAPYCANKNMLGTKNGKSFHSSVKSSPGSEWGWFMENETSRYSEVQRTVPMVRPFAALMWSVMVLPTEWWWENGLPVQEPLKWLITVRRENNGLWPVTLSFSQRMYTNEEGGTSWPLLWLAVPQDRGTAVISPHPQTTNGDKW